ncbi:MAG: class III poly(R)-hydroxyalkanoic acid synthase subunit PhaC [Chloroflexi bacterium]|nr:class III poly(R)-hydroxyalkanoic acid synthase subunit PhaC [Chloroflexota bacterium]
MAGSAKHNGSGWPLPGPIWTSAERALDFAHVVLTAKEAPIGQTPKDVVWRKNKSRLYRYRRTTPATQRTPVFLCVPLINRPDILDLRPGGSFVEFLLSLGFDVFIYEWGRWGSEDRNINLTDVLTRYLPRAVEHASAAAGTDVTLLGYCIGGSLSACFAALYPEAPMKNLVLFTAPIDFAHAGDFGVWTAKGAFPIDKIREVLPAMPGELIDVASKMLNPLVNTVGVYVRLWDKLGNPSFDVEGWQTMYRWVNEGTPFPAAAYHQWITEFYQENKLVRGTLEIAGRPVRLSAISLPLLAVVATADTIAPRPSANAVLEHVSSTDKEELLLEGGHVGTVAGSAARHSLWPRLADWLVRHD